VRHRAFNSGLPRRCPELGLWPWRFCERIRQFSPTAGDDVSSPVAARLEIPPNAAPPGTQVLEQSDCAAKEVLCSAFCDPLSFCLCCS
jgi:hypothetical protein